MDRYLQRADAALHQCAGGLSLEQLTRRPSDKWTIAEILEHLARAFSGTEAGAHRALARGRPAASTADLSAVFRIWVVVECGYLPAGRPAPAMTLPQGIDPGTALVTAIDSLRRMDAALNAAAAQFGAGVKLMDHPILGPLSTRQWRRFHWVHTRHHVRQIRARLADR
jgi:hypothetical protein